MTPELAALVLAAAGAYALAAAVLTMLPGPDTAVVLASAMHGGRRAAARAAGGVAVGLLVWAGAASLGVAAILRASAEWYTVFKVVCIAYLLWLAFGALRAAVRRRREGTEVEVAVRAHRFSLPWGFRRALLTALLNPKLGVFFVAFLPQFVPEGTSSLWMTLLFGAIQSLEALIWYLVLGGIAALVRTTLNRPRVRRAIDAVTGAVFVVFGARLALDV